jgi:CheY-like chemotaxis protein
VRPDLILLDLNLPRKDGREVLAEIKAEPALKTIPVVVLTTSRAEQDVLRSYELQANCFVTKPVNLDQFIGVVKSIEDFWLTVVRLPDLE